MHSLNISLSNALKRGFFAHNNPYAKFAISTVFLVILLQSIAKWLQNEEKKSKNHSDTP